jgi:hypothetical protein
MKVLCFVRNKTASPGGSIHLRASVMLAGIQWQLEVYTLE